MFIQKFPSFITSFKFKLISSIVFPFVQISCLLYKKCINNKKIEDHILEDRIESVKKFEINSTPTLIINNKKFNKTLTYKNLKKAIEKLI